MDPPPPTHRALHISVAITPRAHIVLGPLHAIALSAVTPLNPVSHRIPITTLHKEQAAMDQLTRMLEPRSSIHRNSGHRAIILPMEAEAA